MRKHKMLRILSLIMVGFVPVVLASVPRSHEIVDDSTIYRNLHEIKITHEKSIDFDTDIQRLDQDVQTLSAQKKQKEQNPKVKKLPYRVSVPLNRILHTAYKAS